MRTSMWIAATLATSLALAPVGSAAGPSRSIAFTAVAKSQKETMSTRVVHDLDYLGSTQIGTDVFTCKAATSTCVAVFTFFTLPKGTITVQSVGQGANGSGKVVGGTGAYAGVSGTFTYIDLNTANTITGITIQLS